MRPYHEQTTRGELRDKGQLKRATPDPLETKSPVDKSRHPAARLSPGYKASLQRARQSKKGKARQFLKVELADMSTEAIDHRNNVYQEVL